MVEQKLSAIGVVSSAEDSHDFTGRVLDTDRCDFEVVIRISQIIFFKITGLNPVHLFLDVLVHVGVYMHGRCIRIKTGKVSYFVDDLIDISLIRDPVSIIRLGIRILEHIFDPYRFGQLIFIFGYIAVVSHLIENLGNSFLSCFQIVERIVVVRSVDDTGQQSSFNQSTFTQILAEVILGSLLDTTDVVGTSEVELIDIGFEDILF